MLELILVRHGETAGNLRPTALGTTDLPLTERGRRQANSLSRVFALKRPEAIYTSPLRRASETAEAIAQPHGITVETIFDLCERRFGIWENMAVDDIRAEYEAEYTAWQQDLADYAIPGGESARQVYDRCAEVINELLKKHNEGSVVVVSHLGTIRCILAYLLGMGIEGSWRFQVNNGGICRVMIDENASGVLTAFNEV
ncbi:MAG: histidine phosphatase family protein [Clostridia bacterium]|nr:histidine phosphatase family protein [Clostridia bacterium]